MNYWEERMAKSQNILTSKNIKQVEKQINKYYISAAEQLVRDFEATYDKLLATIEDGKEPTPADLYKLDKYWELQGQIKDKLNKMGKKQEDFFSNAFQLEFNQIYKSIDIPDRQTFNTLQAENVKQMINQIWVADGFSWSDRVWKNTEKLAETLNKELINCVITGKTTSQLKKTLMERFDVSYHNANTIARTEMAHIQSQAAKQRYQDYGITEVKVLVDEDERTCPVCGKLEGQHFPINGQMPVPAHPNCRCCVVPVVD